MKNFLLLTFALMFIFNAHSGEVYKCTDSAGRQHFQDKPCDGRPTGIQAKSDTHKPEELVGERLDKAMWVLLEEPYRSNDKMFIDHVVENDLVLKKDSDGDTVLSVAALNGQTDVMDYLVKNGARVDSTNKRGYTIFSFATKLNDRVKVALIHYGADINHPGEQGHTPLINAVLFDDLHTVKFLLSHGANSDLVDDKGGSALFFAAAQGNMEIVKSLVESGADVNVGKEFKPLKGALGNSHYLVSAYLKLQGASL
jgi:hypothetical protein